MNDYRLLILISGVCLPILSGISPVYAEGTRQLMPSGSGSDCVSYVQGNDGTGKEGSTIGRPSTDWIYVHIEDPSEETIFFGFSRKLPSSQEVYYQILAPDGSVHCSGKVASSVSDPGFVPDDGVAAYVGPLQIAGARSGGYEALECTPTVAGDYAILFNVGHPSTPNTSRSKYYIHPFDITVAKEVDDLTPVAVDGRVFSYKWHLNTNSSRNRACMEFYTWTPDSMVVEMDMNGMQPWGYSVSFNSHGSANTGDIVADRKSSSRISEAVPGYRVFLNPPDSVAYPSGTPGRVSFIEINACTLDSTYCIQVNATKPGELNVYIDLNGTGSYEAGTEDVYFPYQTDTSGTVCVPWDGIDGFGNPIREDAKGNVTVEFLAGVVHFPVYDPENHENGFRCSVIRPSGYQPQMYYDNEDTPIGTSDTEGCDSLCNPWTSSKGDRIMVNTWLNTRTSTDTDSFAVMTECPPIAANDTFCTRVNTPVQVSILTNDSDLDNALDPHSVQLTGIEENEGTASFDAETGLLTYFPMENDSADVKFSYTLCDSTGGGRGGALCSEAEVYFTVHNECLATTILGFEAFPLEAHPSDDQALLDWGAVEDCEYYVIDRSLDGEEFEQIGMLPDFGHPQIRFTDAHLSETGGKQAIYRVKAYLNSQEVRSSSLAGVSIHPSIPLHLSAHVPPGGDQVRILYQSPEAGQLRVYDLMGKKSISPIHLCGFSTNRASPTIHSLGNGDVLLQALPCQISEGISVSN